MAYEVLVNKKDIKTMQIQFAGTVTKEYNAAIASSLGITIPEGYTAINTSSK
jgi:putative ABC transport system substrate-binding protein